MKGCVANLDEAIMYAKPQLKNLEWGKFGPFAMGIVRNRRIACKKVEISPRIF